MESIYLISLLPKVQKKPRASGFLNHKLTRINRIKSTATTNLLDIWGCGKQIITGKGEPGKAENHFNLY